MKKALGVEALYGNCAQHYIFCLYRLLLLMAEATYQRCPEVLFTIVAT